MINGLSHRQIESITCEGINFMYVSVDYGFILLSLIFRLRHAKQKAIYRGQYYGIFIFQGYKTISIELNKGNKINS
jgi:hypothetical protein